MNITLTGSLLRIQWTRFADENIEAEIVRRLESIPTAMHNREGTCWYVNIAHLDALIDLFPKASIDAAAWATWKPQFEAFYVFLVSIGVELKIGPTGAVFSPSLDSDHILQKLIAERSEALKRLMGLNHSESKPVDEPMAQPALFNPAISFMQPGRKRRKRAK